MADLNHTHSKSANVWPMFTDGHTVIGRRLLDFVDWVAESKRVLAEGADPGPMPIIALPPVQRSAVWRPKQVLDLWDSLMRGLPIGTFYLVSQPGGQRDVVVPGTNETTCTAAKGFDLLDGQQRVRALMVGVLGPADEKRCLWVDLGAETAGQSPCLRLTSKAQPFGYDAKSGNKLPLDQRRKAREAIEPKGHPLQRANEAGDLRPAYDIELFEDNKVIQDGKPLRQQPPLPYGTSDGGVFELHKLLAAWRGCASSDTEKRVAALRSVVGSASALEGPLNALHKAFCNVEKAQVALLRVEPGNPRDGKQDLLALFERIGAGGTPLSREERLYSIYKHYVPEIRKTVDDIHQGAGRVLPPTKIVAVALRIANALSDDCQNGTPDPIAFTSAMTAGPENPFVKKLGQLLPSAAQVSGNLEGTLSRSFERAKFLLSHDDGIGDFWLPDVMLTMLPVEFWQVLVFWATIHPDAADRVLCRQEAVRFALFWHLCVWNHEKAASTAFAYLKKTRAENMNFPGEALYRRLTGATQSEALAHALLSPDEFKSRLCMEGESPAWRTDEERFVKDKRRNDIGSNWWWHGRKMLPWLQRDYIRETFPGYMPLSEHEDDLPYDFDHICPDKDWGDDWRSVERRLDTADLHISKRMRDGRDAVGNGIGNLRLVDSSTNRHDQDTDVSEKMPFVTGDGEASDADRQAMAKSAFLPEHRALWKRVSRKGDVKERRWSDDRLAAFQCAVEQRAAWLYHCFYDQLGYKAWISAQLENESGQ